MKIASRRLLSAAVSLACARIASAQTADDVIEKLLAALGGRTAIAKLTSRSLAGTNSVTKVEHNVKIDEALFSKPASSK